MLLQTSLFQGFTKRNLSSKNTLEIQEDPNAEAEPITEREENGEISNVKESNFRTEKAQSFLNTVKSERKMISPK
jgi:hypothetical protein